MMDEETALGLIANASMTLAISRRATVDADDDDIPDRDPEGGVIYGDHTPIGGDPTPCFYWTPTSGRGGEFFRRGVAAIEYDHLIIVGFSVDITEDDQVGAITLHPTDNPADDIVLNPGPLGVVRVAAFGAAAKQLYMKEYR